MAIFSAFLRSPPESPTRRAVPNGGLGGLVQLKGREKKTRAMENGTTQSQSKKTTATAGRKNAPPPIRINNTDAVGVPFQSAPLHRTGYRTTDTVWKTSKSPLIPMSATAFVLSDDGVHTLENMSPAGFFSESWGAQLNSMKTAPLRSTTVTSKFEGPTKVRSPAELPGSLLMPNQGVAIDPSPPYLEYKTQPRAFSERPPSPSSDSITSSKVSQPSDRQGSLGSLNTNLSSVQDGSLTAPLLAFPNINTLGAANLVQMLRTFQAERLISEWLPAIEKEMDKYKGLLIMYLTRTEVNAGHVISICYDLESLILQLKHTTSSACKQFERAQADVDDQQRTDLEKLRHIEEELHAVMLSYNTVSCDVNLETREYQLLEHTLQQAITTLGGCIRNLLAYRLFESSQGLTEEAVKALRAYKKRDDCTARDMSTEVPAQIYEHARKESVELQKTLDEYKMLVMEQRQSISKTSDAQEKLEKQTQEQTKALYERTLVISELENDNAVLKERVSKLLENRAGQEIAFSDVPWQLDEQHVRNVAVVSGSYAQDSERNPSIPGGSDVMIEDLLQHVNAMVDVRDLPATKSGFEGTEISLPDPTVQTILEQQVTVKTGRKKFLGSRILSKAILPISNGITNLLSPREASFKPVPIKPRQPSLHRTKSRRAQMPRVKPQGTGGHKVIEAAGRHPRARSQHTTSIDLRTDRTTPHIRDSTVGSEALLQPNVESLVIGTQDIASLIQPSEPFAKPKRTSSTLSNSARSQRTGFRRKSNRRSVRLSSDSWSSIAARLHQTQTLAVLEQDMSNNDQASQRIVHSDLSIQLEAHFKAKQEQQQSLDLIGEHGESDWMSINSVDTGMSKEYE